MGGGSGGGSGEVSQSKLWGLESILKHICQWNSLRQMTEKVSNYFLDMEFIAGKVEKAFMWTAEELYNLRPQACLRSKKPILRPSE